MAIAGARSLLLPPTPSYFSPEGGRASSWVVTSPQRQGMWEFYFHHLRPCTEKNIYIMIFWAEHGEIVLEPGAAPPGSDSAPLRSVSNSAALPVCPQPRFPKLTPHRARVGLFAPVAWPEHGSCSIRGFKISEWKKWFQNAGPARYSVLTGFCGRITWGNVRRPEGSRHARHTMLKALRSPARDAVPAALSKPTFPRAFRSQALSPLSALDRASGGAGLQSEPVVVVGRGRQAGGRSARQPISAAPGPHVYFPCVL